MSYVDNLLGWGTCCYAGARRVGQEPFGRLPWFADFLRRVARLLVRLDIVVLPCGLAVAQRTRVRGGGPHPDRGYQTLRGAIRPDS